ncbi:MAG: DUF58 domain-containing protein [Treponemataceae bacterium]|nr:DUF58 domain-containing protein [Treponemataceae bacterium]
MKKKPLLISDSTTLTKSASALRLRSRSIAEEMKAGNFASMFRGQGIEFAGVREYLPGDDVRSIDWNVTARMDKTFVKLYEEEREQTVFLIVDRSLSMETGSVNYTRLNIATETAALLLLAGQYNSCPVGTVLFDGKITFSCTPKKGKENTMLILTKLSQRSENVSAGSALTNALQGAGKTLKKRSMVFVISDFRCSGYEEKLARLAQKHDVAAIRITDGNDSQLPKLGFIRIRDPETNNESYAATNSSHFQQAWRDNNKNTISRWKHMCKKHGVVPLLISTADDPALRLAKFFAVREKV